jgi:hypothetical protein
MTVQSLNRRCQGQLQEAASAGTPEREPKRAPVFSD